jgi:hypothetical protein
MYKPPHPIESIKYLTFSISSILPGMTSPDSENRLGSGLQAGGSGMRNTGRTRGGEECFAYFQPGVRQGQNALDYFPVGVQVNKLCSLMTMSQGDVFFSPLLSL